LVGDKLTLSRGLYISSSKDYLQKSSTEDLIIPEVMGNHHESAAAELKVGISME
jgi:hypothetical protein